MAPEPHHAHPTDDLAADHGNPARHSPGLHERHSGSSASPGRTPPARTPGTTPRRSGAGAGGACC